MQRGEVIRVDFGNPPGGAGHEQAGERPAVVVSLGDNDTQNPLVTIVPFTGRMSAQRFPHTILVNPSQTNGLSTPSVLLIFQIRSLQKRRVIRVIGRLEAKYMAELESMIMGLLSL